MREINRTVISVVVVALPLTVISLLTVWPRGLSLAFGVSLLFIAACRLLEKEHRLADVKRWRRVAQDLKIAGHPCEARGLSLEPNARGCVFGLVRE